MLMRRLATQEELTADVEVISYKRIESYCKRIEKRNLKTKGKSTSFASMGLPIGIITEIQDGEFAVIHKNWRKILVDAYEHGINPVLVPVEERR